MFSLNLSPLEMCSKLKFFTIRDDIVPFPEAGAPSISALNSLVAIFFRVLIYLLSF